MESGEMKFILSMGILGVLMAFWIWMLVDCATKEKDEENTKIVWVGIILVANWIGALVYLFVRRPQRKKEMGR